MPQQPAKTPKILIVDDELQNIKLLEAYLMPLGYDILAANSGAQALSLVHQNSLDLVLLDVVMPDMDGFAVCRQIKQMRGLVAPVVLVTSMGETQVKVAGLEIGADDFITKPVEREELVARVRAHLRIKFMMDEIKSWNALLEHKVRERTRLIHLKNLQLAQSYNLTLDTLINALDMREHETGRHSLRVAFYTAELTKAWKGWPIKAEELKEIAMGALVHDVGKIGISDNILLKPGKLTPEEWVVMKKHPQMGHSIVEGIEFIGLGRDLVLAHHERFDGGGYPRGLKGDEIYIGARFFAVADTLDAMTNDRPYRRALTFEQCEEELRRCSGSQFDPRVVETFFSISRERWAQLSQEADQSNFTTLINLLEW